MVRALDHPANPVDPAPPLTAHLVVHVVPRSAATALAGRYGDALKIRIAAPPSDGAANAELISFLARRLNVPRSAIIIRSGQASRRKHISIEGMTTAAVLRVLERA